MAPVPTKYIQYAYDHGLVNVDTAALACRMVGLPFYAACALLTKESSGKNVWGHDKVLDLVNGEVVEWGVNSGWDGPVNKDTFLSFYYNVVKLGMRSNGVGPCQITWAGSVETKGALKGQRNGGYFALMMGRAMDPWDPYDNMLFGFDRLQTMYEKYKSWSAAGRVYNGRQSYGDDLQVRVHQWHVELQGL